jgi:hypothetical protein
LIIKTLKGANRASACGAIAAYLVASVSVVTLITSGLGAALPVGVLSGGVLDFIIFAALGWGISRYSRTCAVVALLLYMFKVADFFLKFWPYTAIVVCANTVLYFLGILGTFSFHKLKNADAIASTSA